ncbi:MAG: NHL repeat containing protein [candidate division WS6 bacterium GW2011_GWF2_39_15]|uniref:NHL repeat containing protein n=1 Tax=candidate division WS6 bacterium GW2011_GWF2_39_15 TaxID=1619100 RepID=A0A0G0MYW4_9BACT|nr:MAG: NHL repeat containing protein [candidate division WS6 bacterium GW2011_GWF2_39_15]
MKIYWSRITISFLFAAFILMLSPLKISASFNTETNLPADYVNMGIPEDLLVLPDGNIWYVDSQNTRVVKVDPSGNILRTVGRAGTDEGEFECPIVALTIDAEDHLYILSSCKVYVLDFNGGILDSWGENGVEFQYQFGNPRGITYDLTTDSILIADAAQHEVLSFSIDGTFNFGFGSFGAGAGQLNAPVGITTDALGNIYVADGDNHRISVFESNGDFISTIGSEGVGDGEFTFIKDVEILSDGSIAATSQNSQKVQIFNSSGVFVDSWGAYGSAYDEFHFPQYIAKDIDDNLYVSDWGLKSIQKFSKTGVFSWKIRNAGQTNGRFSNPVDVAYDSVGNLYVLDDAGDAPRLQKFTNSGTFIEVFADFNVFGLGTYHVTIDDNDRVYVTSSDHVTVLNPNKTVHLSFGVTGSGNGEFLEARGIDVDSLGNIYVADWGNRRVQKFDSSGVYVTQWGVSGAEDGNFDSLSDLYIDGDDNIYVVDGSDPFDVVEGHLSRIQVFDTAGNFIRSIGTGGEAEGEFSNQIGKMEFDGSGNLWITDIDRHKILIFDNLFNYVESVGTYGAGIAQFFNPNGLVYNSVTGTMTVADQNNHRVQGVGEGVRIYNLIPSTDVIRNDIETSLVNISYDPSEVGIDSLASEMYFGAYVVSDFEVDLTTDRNWEAVNAMSLPEESIAIVTNLNPVDAPGVSETHSLYVPKLEGQIGVYVCPDAVTTADVSIGCASGYKLINGDVGLSSTTIDTIDYWVVSSLTGTAAMGIFGAQTFDVSASKVNVAVGETFSLSVTALDINSNTAILYDGTVEFTATSLDGLASYSFTSLDSGAHNFLNLFSFDAPGDYTVTVTDATDPTIIGESQIIHVSAIPVDDTPVDDTPVDDTPIDDGNTTGNQVVNNNTGVPEIVNTTDLNGDDEDEDLDDKIDDIINPDNNGGNSGTSDDTEDDETDGDIKADRDWMVWLNTLWALPLIFLILFLLSRKRNEKENS